MVFGISRTSKCRNITEPRVVSWKVEQNRVLADLTGLRIVNADQPSAVAGSIRHLRHSRSGWRSAVGGLAGYEFRYGHPIPFKVAKWFDPATSVDRQMFLLEKASVGHAGVVDDILEVFESDDRVVECAR